LYIILIIYFLLFQTNNCNTDLIIQSINDIYYNIKTMDIDSFSCEVVIDDISKNNYTECEKLESINKLYYPLKISEKDISFRKPLNKYGDEKSEKEIKDLVKPYKNVILNFFLTWYELSMNPILEPLEFDYIFSNNLDTVFMANSKTDIKATLLFDTDKRLYETIMSSSTVTKRLKTNFVETKGGYCLKDFQFVLNDSENILSYTVNYMESDNVLLPSKIEYKSNTMEFTFKVLNYSY